MKRWNSTLPTIHLPLVLSVPMVGVLKPPILAHQFWGKLRRDGTGAEAPLSEWHPLVDHCADVAACTVALLGQRGDGFAPTILNRRLARLGGLEELDESQVGRLGALAALHDIGKCNRGFQNRADPEPAFRAGHVEPGFALLPFTHDCSALQRRFAELLPESWDHWAKDPYTILRLLAAALGHHGEPGRIGTGVDERFWLPGEGRDPFAGLQLLVDAVRHWPLALDRSSEPLPHHPAFQHGFAGLVQLADWVGSDTTLFPYSDDLGGRWPIAAAVRAVTELGLDGEGMRRLLPTPDFMRISDGRVARPAQEAIGHLPLPASASTLLLEDETGAGKTEAALWWFARLFAAGLVDGLYFALPTRTAATQIQRRVTDVIKRLWPNEPRPPVVLAVPGYIRVDEETGQRPLTGFGVLWNDRQRHPERWAAEHPKRYLAGTVVVGTIDQVLLAALKTSHSHLRATCLLRHLLVVDEVHASDAYMTTILEQVLAHHRAAGGHALLMSATLGSTVRARLLATEPEWDLANACTRPYPLISRDDGQPSVPVRPWSASRAITLDPVALIDDAQAIAAAAIQAAHNGARVLIIRNTVSGCLAVFNAIARAEPELLWRCNGTPAPHHARFAREDREALDQHLESSFGGASPSRGMIACATQTVQQALDIDADFLVSDLCPADVLLQRLGRLHRHRSRQRPAGFSAPRALILVPTRPLVDLITANGQPRGKHGLGAVYPDLRMLDATWQLVAVRSVTIPDDNRRWVEAITHPEALRPYASLDERWKKHEPLALGSDQARRQIAATNCCDWSASFGGDATGKQHELFREDDLDQTIRTRLGTSDRLVDLPPGTTGPFGITIRRLTLPGWWLEQRQVPHDAPISVEVLGDHLAIHYGDHVFRYDAQGLRPIEATDEDAKADA